MTNTQQITPELQSHLLRLYQMALTDEEFDILELKMIYRFAEDRGISKSVLDKLLLTPNKYNKIPEDIHTRIEYLYDLAQLIWVDQKIDASERSLLKKYCRQFEFLEENIEQLSEYLLDAAQNNLSKSQLLSELNN